MSVKRALVIATCLVAVASVGDAVVVATSAAGTPAAPAASLPQPAVVAAPPAAPLPAAPAKPHSTLQLSTTLHLVDHTTGVANVNSSHVAISAALLKNGNIQGSAAYTCAESSGRVTGCFAALALTNGVFLAKLNAQPNGNLNGQITGGSGAYAGATGSVSAVQKRPGFAALTISYSVN